MSRTDVHRPGWVKDHDPFLRRHIRIVHDHWHEERFPCEHVPPCVPERWENTPTHRVRRTVECSADERDGRCRRWYIVGNIYCGCPSCTGSLGRRLTRRRDRHDGQRLCRALAKDRRAGEDLPTRMAVKQLWWSPSAVRRARSVQAE